MDCHLPPPAARLINGKTRVFAPPAIYEITATVGPRGPDQAWKRVHNFVEISAHHGAFLNSIEFVYAANDGHPPRLSRRLESNARVPLRCRDMMTNWTASCMPAFD